MNILLTGANGFVGKNLIPLIAKNNFLTLYDLRQPENHFESNCKIEFIKGDISVGENFSKINWEKLDLILHLAASGVKASNRNWKDCEAVNVNGVKNLLHAVECLHKIPRLIYPRTFYEDFIDKYEVLKKNPYFFTKYLATKYILEWAETNKSAQISFPKIYQAYGPGDDSGNVLSYTLQSLLSHSTAKLSSGNALRDWIYIDDLNDLFTLTINYNQQKQIEFLDFGTGILTTVKSMTEFLVKIIGCSDELLSFNSALDRQDVELISCAEHFLPGWLSKYPIEKGLNLFVNIERSKLSKSINLLKA